MNIFKCSICGKFIGYKEFDENKILTEYTPETEYSFEDFNWAHKDCMEKQNQKIEKMKTNRINEQTLSII